MGSSDITKLTTYLAGTTTINGVFPITTTGSIGCNVVTPVTDYSFLSETGTKDPFNPNDNDFIIWLKSDYGLTLGTNDKVLGWNDYSSAGNNCDPQYFTNTKVIGDYNGYPLVGLSSSGGSTNIWQLNNPKRCSGSDPYLTMIAVFRTANTNPTNDFGPINFGGGGYYSNRGVAMEDSPSGFGLHYYGGSLLLSSETIISSKVYNVAITCDESASIAVGYVDGEQTGSASMSTLGTKTMSVVGGGTNYLGMSDLTWGVLELLAFRRVLSQSEIVYYQSYLAQKYGL